MSVDDVTVTKMSYYQFARGFRMVVPHMEKVKRFVPGQCAGENIIDVKIAILKIIIYSDNILLCSFG